MEDGSLHMDPVHLRLGNHRPGTKADLSEYESAVRHYDALATPPYFKVSTTVHARRLLAKMGSNHPAAKTAGKLL